MPVTEFRGFKQADDTEPPQQSRQAADDDDEEREPIDEAPWRRRAYGSLLKTPRIAFVAEGSTALTPGIPRPKSTKPASEISSWYLNHVLNSKPTPASSRTSPQPSDTEHALCPSCNLPLHATHATSIAHQCSLSHSHPPHSLNRSSVGLKVLEKHGWDPDARVGLGKSGEGIVAPVKVVEKKGKEGVGRKVVKGEKREEVRRMGAKEARRHAERERRARMALMAELSR